MMSSGSAQNQRPASAPGEDAPLADLADRNEVNVSLVVIFTSLHPRTPGYLGFLSLPRV